MNRLLAHADNRIPQPEAPRRRMVWMALKLALISPLTLARKVLTSSGWIALAKFSRTPCGCMDFDRCGVQSKSPVTPQHVIDLKKSRELYPSRHHNLAGQG